MSYTQKHYKEIFLKDLEESQEAGLISHREEFIDYIKSRKDISNFHVMNLSIEAQRFDYTYDDITEVYKSNKVGLALGNDLDDLGDIINCPRPQATSAGVEVTFTLNNPSSEDINIPSGIILSGKAGINYITAEEIYFPAHSKITTAYAYSAIPGVNGKIIEEDLNTIVSKISEYYTGSIGVTNLNASSGGYEAYNDEEYRALLKEWIKSNQKGNKAAFEKFFANLDGIDGYKLVPNWDMTGTVKIIVDPGDVYVLRTIYTRLQEEVTQMTEDIYLTAPEKVEIDVYAKVNIDLDTLTPYDATFKNDIKSKIKSAIKIFINGGYRADNTYYKGLAIGEDFIPHKLQVFLDQEIKELKSINFSYPNGPIVVGDEEQCVSHEITIIME